MPSGDETLQNKRYSLTDKTAVVLVTYNDMEYIQTCLESVYDNEPGEVVVVDNGSTDGTVDVIKNEFPETTLIQMDHNPGPGSANNRGVQEVDSEYVVILNTDTIIDSNLIHELVQPIAENGPQITVPKILTYNGNIINTIGNIIHFSGLAFTRGYGEPSDAYSETKQLTGISGACFATTRETYQEMCGFEDSMFIYMDDTELSWKANALGIDILYIPTAIVYHDYQGIKLGSEKLYHLEIGRYIILRKYLTAKTLALIFPSLVITEILTWGYAVSQGLDGVKAKLKAISEGFSADVDTAGNNTQALLYQLDKRIPVEQLQFPKVVKAGIEAANKLYELNHSLLKR